MDSSSMQQIDLAAGQTFSGWLPCGSVIVVEAGRVSFRPPARWLAGHLLYAAFTLAPEAHVRIAEAGVHALTAQTGARCVLLPPAPGLLQRLWRAGWQRVRRSRLGGVGQHARA